MIETVFLGTPEAALPTLELLATQTELKGVLTQPDRPRGRSRKPKFPPVKIRSQELGIGVRQPHDRSSLDDALAALSPYDVAVVVAYGRILSKSALGSARVGMLNVHFSLLPRWRGAAPVARALMAGDTMTGVTIIELDEGLDTGPVLTAQAIDIHPEENRGELTQKLSQAGAKLLNSVIREYASGDLQPVPQSDQGVTYAHTIAAEDRALSIDCESGQFVNHVRGLSPAPGAYLVIDGSRVKILSAEASPVGPGSGSWVLVDGWPVVGVAEGWVRLTTVQPPGKTAMAADAWARGRPRTGGSVGG